MGGWTTLGFLLLAPAAPLPGPTAATTVSRVDRDQALLFAGGVVQLAYQVNEEYVRPVEVKELLECALRGLYEEVGLACPEEVILSIRRGHSSSDFGEALANARVSLGDAPALEGPRALFAAINGFRYATDPYTGLVGPRATTFVSIEMDCGIGLELEGVNGGPLDPLPGRTRLCHGPVPVRPGHWQSQAPEPAGVVPLRVRRIIPGSPCQRAGLRPGDVITHVNGKAITAASSPRLFRELINSQTVYDPVAPRSDRRPGTFRIRRDGKAEPFDVLVKPVDYVPESVFGVNRVDDDQWNHVLDRDYRIGYIRLGSIESGSDLKVSEVLAGLEKRDCRGLILDLRWCPGGFVDPASRTTGLFLEEGAVITQMTTRRPIRGAPDLRVSTPTGWAKYADKPLVVLIGPETIGGGEMIASALQDHTRAVLIGQRTVGKGNIQSTPFSPHIGDLQFKISTGYSLRPNGKNRHRFADSKPTDDWGVRPDVGFEAPVTGDLSVQLKKWADLQALRPASSREALPFDDPALDPHRLLALQYLRKKLGPVEEKRQ